MKQPTVGSINEFMMEWDYERNKDNDPKRLTLGSDTKVWWKCNRGHSYLQAIKNHTLGERCPYCCGKLALPGFNDLATVNPVLAVQWDNDKNGTLKPSDFRAFSNKKVWWKCYKGHSWRASINRRNTGNGCPYCSNRKALKGENDMGTLFPELAMQWDYEKNVGLTPEMVVPGSNRYAWWKCHKGHSWRAVISSRTIRKMGCPYCGGRRRLVGYNDLATVNPELATQWDYDKNAPLRPCDVTAHYKTKVWWKCPEGHSWKAQVSNRSNGTGCPYCKGKRVIVGKTDLLSTHEEIREIWNYDRNTITPDSISPCSGKKVWWKCPKGHEWRALVSDVAIAGTRCPICAGHKIIVGDNDLATVRPDIAAEWDYEKNGRLNPKDVTVSGKRYIWWKCVNGHSWKAPIYRRTAGAGCPYCCNRYIAKGESDLATLRPDLMTQWNYEKNTDIVPTEISPGSNYKVWWRCEKGHEWKAAVVGRTVNGVGCPYCKGKKAITGETDLRTVRPMLMKEWHSEKNVGIDPCKIKPHSYKRVWWKCSKGHEWIASIQSRTEGSGCPYCSGQIRIRPHFVS